MAGISNFFQSYYQGDHSVNPSHNIKKVYKDREKSVRIGSFEYHKIILGFLQERGIDTTIFRRYKNQAECRSRINAMFTTLKKEGLLEEFWDYYDALKGGDTSDKKSNHQG